MTVIATALRHLMSAGVTGDDLVEAISEIEAAMTATIAACVPTPTGGADDTELPTWKRNKRERDRARYQERKLAKTGEIIGENVNSANNVGEIANSVGETLPLSPSPLPFPPDPPNQPPAPTPPVNKSRARERPAGFALPEHIPVESWDAFVEMRKTLKNPLTDRAKALAVKRLDELASQGFKPSDVLDQSVLRGWQGLFEVKGSQPFASGRQPPPQPDLLSTPYRPRVSEHGA